MKTFDLNEVKEALDQDPTYTDAERRRTLKTLGQILGSVVAGGVLMQLTRGVARAAEPATDDDSQRKHNWGMVIDVRRCVGCKACVIACKQENKTPPAVNYPAVKSETFKGSESDHPIPFTRPCFHCEKPACVPVCPADATYKRPEDGIVVVDYDACIGCRQCVEACPYKARYFDEGNRYRKEMNLAEDVPSPEYGQYRERKNNKSPVGCARKCSYCMHLQDENGDYRWTEGRWPSCAKTCTGKSIHFGDLSDPKSEVSRLLRGRKSISYKSEFGTKPRVHYLL